jgi:hypothetical protein
MPLVSTVPAILRPTLAALNEAHDAVELTASLAAFLSELRPAAEGFELLGELAAAVQRAAAALPEGGPVHLAFIRARARLPPGDPFRLGRISHSSAHGAGLWAGQQTLLAISGRLSAHPHEGREPPTPAAWAAFRASAGPWSRWLPLNASSGIGLLADLEQEYAFAVADAGADGQGEAPQPPSGQWASPLGADTRPCPIVLSGEAEPPSVMGREVGRVPPLAYLGLQLLVERYPGGATRQELIDLAPQNDVVESLRELRRDRHPDHVAWRQVLKSPPKGKPRRPTATKDTGQTIWHLAWPEAPVPS